MRDCNLIYNKHSGKSRGEGVKWGHFWCGARRALVCVKDRKIECINAEIEAGTHTLLRLLRILLMVRWVRCQIDGEARVRAVPHPRPAARLSRSIRAEVTWARASTHRRCTATTEPSHWLLLAAHSHSQSLTDTHQFVRQPSQISFSTLYCGHSSLSLPWYICLTRN